LAQKHKFNCIDQMTNKDGRWAHHKFIEGGTLSEFVKDDIENGLFKNLGACLQWD
jgi:hypothetical protein